MNVYAKEFVEAAEKRLAEPPCACGEDDCNLSPRERTMLRARVDRLAAGTAEMTAHEDVEEWLLRLEEHFS